MPDRSSEHAVPADLDTAQDEIRQLRERLDAAEQRADSAEKDQRCFRELAEHIQEVFWMTNPLGNQLVYISPAYEQIWGQTCQSLYEDPGRRLTWVHGADREHVLTAFKRDAPSGQYDEIFRINRPDDGIRWIRDRAFPVHDDNGKLYRLAGFALDITECIENNDRINTLHTDLDAQERASVFAALGTGLAHDLSQPLTAARNFLAHARRTLSDDQHILTRADEQIQRTGDIIRHLRPFARYGKPILTRQPLAPILEDVYQMMEPILRDADIDYHGPSPGSITDVELPMDGLFVQQILRNLLTNAADAAGADRQARRISVDVQRTSQANSQGNSNSIDIQVCDNGQGLSADIEPFESFATTKDDGLGLGLAVSRMLARSQNGDLILARGGGDSNGADNNGACFVLRLPCNLLEAH